MDSMEKVVLIYEESHSLIRVAINYYAAATFLIEHNWLDEDTMVWDGKTHKEVLKILGTEWKDLILNWWSLEKFNEFFEGVFYLYPEEVYDGE